MFKRLLLKNYALFLIALFYFGVVGYNYQNDNKRIPVGDSLGYYIYLPTTFIYQDWADLRKTYSAENFPARTIEPIIEGQPISGTWGLANYVDKKPVVKYSSGVAVCNIPFFALAHIIVKIKGDTADGYSSIYVLMYCIATCVYALLGFLFMKKNLCFFFSERTANITVLLIAFATNIFYLSVSNVPLSHPYIFGLYAILIYLSEKHYREPSNLYAFYIGLIIGLITLLRPTEIVCAIVPILWGFVQPEKKIWISLYERILFLLKSYKHLIITGFAIFLVSLPQLLYWKVQTGHFLFYSYVGEPFDFWHPHIIEGLFSFSNGWLIYTPIMLFAILGIINTSFSKPWQGILLLLLPVYIYIIYSWWCWAYIGALGSRPMVAMYPLLAFPFAIFIEKYFIKTFSMFLLSTVFLFFIYLNILQSWQYKKQYIVTEMQTISPYFDMMFKLKPDSLSFLKFDTSEPQADSAKLHYIKQLYHNDFEDSTNVNVQSTNVHSGKYAFLSTPKLQYSCDTRFNLTEKGVKEGDWIKISAWMGGENEGWSLFRMAIWAVVWERGNERIKSNSIRINNKIDNPSMSLHNCSFHKWKRLTFWMKIDKELHPEDTYNSFICNSEDHNTYLCIDDITIDLYREN